MNNSLLKNENFYRHWRKGKKTIEEGGGGGGGTIACQRYDTLLQTKLHEVHICLSRNTSTDHHVISSLIEYG